MSSTNRDPKKSEDWTAIIPAAGLGSRLQTKQPKILYPVLGKPMIEWLVNLVGPLCGKVVLVLSPAGAPQVQPQADKLLGDRAHVILQEKPTGMADAIALCESAVKTRYSLVMWGDQITVRPQSLAACMTLLESKSHIEALVPTIQRENPYIHFERDGIGRVTGVYQARESDEKRAHGESDCGTFLFQTQGLFKQLKAAQNDPAHLGAKTRERNFLTVLPLFDQGMRRLATIELQDPDETLGINTPEDAKRVEEVLKKRQ